MMRRRLQALLLTAVLTFVTVPAAAASAVVPTYQSLACAMPFLSTGFGPLAQCTQLSSSQTTGRAGLYSPITGQFQAQTGWLEVVDVKWHTGNRAPSTGGAQAVATGYASLLTTFGPAVWSTQYRAGNAEGRWGSVNLLTGLFYPAGDGAWSPTTGASGSGKVVPMGGIAISELMGAAKASTVTTFLTLQMNLCNGGGAACFRGGAAVTKARQVIADYAPAMVTLNEICESDATDRLLPVMLNLYRSEWLYWSFMPAGDREAGGAARTCTDSRGRYGNGVIGRLFTETGPSLEYFGQLYPDTEAAPNERQDKASRELRSWLCVDANHQYWGCTTHPDNDDDTGKDTVEKDRVAFNQCNYFTKTVMPYAQAVVGYHPTVLGGDINLTYEPGAKYNVQSCVPSGWFRKGDGELQHTMATNDFGFVSTLELDMEGTTDHPAWIVVLNRPAG